MFPAKVWASEQYASEVLLSLTVAFPSLVVVIVKQFNCLQALEEALIYNNTIDKIIGKNKGNLDDIINELATLPLPELENDSKNIYYCKLAIERKRELARQEKLVDPRIIQKELKKIVKEKNFAWKKKKEYNIRNNLDYKGNPIGKNKDKVWGNRKALRKKV